MEMSLTRSEATALQQLTRIISHFPSARGWTHLRRQHTDCREISTVTLFKVCCMNSSKPRTNPTRFSQDIPHHFTIVYIIYMPPSDSWEKNPNCRNGDTPLHYCPMCTWKAWLQQKTKETKSENGEGKKTQKKNWKKNHRIAWKNWSRPDQKLGKQRTPQEP